MFERQESLFAAGPEQGDLFDQDGARMTTAEQPSAAPRPAPAEAATARPATPEATAPEAATPRPATGAQAAEPPGASLERPQEFVPATSFHVRGELEELIRRDLLGPWDGDRERLPRYSRGPRDRYLVGMLGPRRTAVSVTEDAEEMPDTEATAGGDGEAEPAERLTPQNLGRIWASSMGLSFRVPGEVTTLAVTASWGRYAPAETPLPDGHTLRLWHREPVSHHKEIRLDAPAPYRIPLTTHLPDAPGVHLAVTARRQPDGSRVVEVNLVNAQEEPQRRKDTAWLFQTELTVTAADGASAVFLPINDPLDGGPAGDTLADGAVPDEEEAHLRLLYRDELCHANGRNVAVHAKVRDGERRACELRTTWLPAYDVPATVAPAGDPRLAGTVLSMDALAEAGPAELRAGLAPLADGYRAWLDEQERKIHDLPGTLRGTAEAAIHRARQAAERIRAGIALLSDPAAAHHAEALAAFRFANRAMALQRRHTTIGKLREEHGWDYRTAAAAVAEQGAKAASWRPFQLAFVLLNLPALTDPGHPERGGPTDDPAGGVGVVDLLFFPTGGGKTEAYLGLTAYTFAIRRLQQVVGKGAEARSGLDGVAVLMRYTLRLLTAQQFQRAAALVCAAEVLRRQDPGTWGREPFRIGLWVGAGVSPNWYDEAFRQIDDARTAGRGDRVNVLQTLACPWCGTRLQGHRDLHPDEDLRRVLLYCPNAEGADACPFSRRISPGEGLPILTVDEEIYRLTPSLVIATVDKLAQLPWRGYAGHLFGRVSRRCPRHGYRHEDLDAKTGCTDRHYAKGRLPAVASEPVVRLRPPDLIIQDELHLISGALGTVVGLFEAAVDELCTWSVAGRPTGPKIVASTATTKRSRAQILGVFGRDSAVFPPQVIDVGDTFFSRRVPVTEQTPGRRYLGVCAHGIRLKSAEIRLAEILLLAGQTLFDRYGRPADPYMTLVGYFNATRELAGMRRLLEDDVAIRLRVRGAQRGLSNRLVTRSAMPNVQELTSRISSGDISEVLKRLEYGFDPDLDTATRRRDIPAHMNEMFKTVKGKKDASGKPVEPAFHPLAQRFLGRQRADRQPIDVVLATSMLQVGVDVPRFGLMMVVGQPKNTAEYIQASSRVGREADRPGLVITLYNWTRPRDLAHFEDFEHYHATFYRQVEALSVTPYTRRALDRGTAATFIAAVRNLAEEFSRNDDAHDVPLDGPEVSRFVDRWLTRAAYAGKERARDYLHERITVVREAWERRRGGQFRLGYEPVSTKRKQLAGLLERSGSGRWTDLTVGSSMRETENEINLVLPGGGEIFSPVYDAPEWTFRAGAGPAEAPAEGRE